MRAFVNHIVQHGYQEIRAGGDQTWYRGPSCMFYPYAYESFHLPKLKLAARSPSIVTDVTPRSHSSVFFVGSCIAGDISEVFKKHIRANTFHLYFSEGILNAYSLYRVLYRYLSSNEDSETVQNVQRHVKNATDFIFSLSLSECFYDKSAQQYHEQAITVEEFQSGNFTFKLISYEENCLYLAKLIELIKAHNPRCRIFFTLTPVNVHATFAGQSPVYRSNLSNSLLLSAIYSVLGSTSNCFYLPLYDLSCHSPIPHYLADNRHLEPAYFKAMICLTLSYFFHGHPKDLLSTACLYLFSCMSCLKKTLPLHDSDIFIDRKSHSINWIFYIVNKTPDLKSLIYNTSNKSSQNNYLGNLVFNNPFSFYLLAQLLVDLDKEHFNELSRYYPIVNDRMRRFGRWFRLKEASPI